MLIQNRFFTILEWIQKIHKTMIHDGTMQDILDLSAPVIDNYIAVSDSSLMLMAYTRSIPCDDPICINLVKYGYHPEETVQKWKEFDLFSLWENTDSIYVDDTLATAKYVCLNKIFKFRNVYFAHAVLTCNRKPPTPGMIDLFKMFVDELAVYIERAWEAKSACNHIYETFLTDLIEGSVSSVKVIEERAQYVGIPLSGRYCLFQIVPNNLANMSIGKMLMEFSDLFPRFKFIRYQQRIVALNIFFPNEDLNEQLESICRNLEGFLEKYDAMCGVSLCFNCLSETPFCFKQSTLALKYIGRSGSLNSLINKREYASPRIGRFSQSYAICLLGEHEPNAEVWHHSEYHNMLQKLHEYDVRHKGNTIQILQLYLSLERNATHTGAALNMHRNNVIYHINRIEEMLGVDFGVPSVRLSMLMSLVLMELYGFNSE